MKLHSNFLSLLRVNQHGALAPYNHKVSTEYWKYKLESFDLVCAVDGACGVNHFGTLSGGICGCIKTSMTSMAYVFSGLVSIMSCVHTEIEAILHIMGLISSKELVNKKLVICSDSVVAIEQIRAGLSSYFPIHGRIHIIKSLLGLNVFLHYVLRDLNDNADFFFLAKYGLKKVVMFAH